MRERERERERQRHRQREKQAPRREPHVGLDPRTPGPHPGPKAGSKPISHPGIPSIVLLYPDVLLPLLRFHHYDFWGCFPPFSPSLHAWQFRWCRPMTGLNWLEGTGQRKRKWKRKRDCSFIFNIYYVFAVTMWCPLPVVHSMSSRLLFQKRPFPLLVWLRWMVCFPPSGIPLIASPLPVFFLCVSVFMIYFKTVFPFHFYTCFISMLWFLYCVFHYVYTPWCSPAFVLISVMFLFSFVPLFWVLQMCKIKLYLLLFSHTVFFESIEFCFEFFLP